MSHIKIIDFMGKRNIACMVSALLLLISVGSLAFNGLKLGLDFTGGTAIELLYAEEPNLAEVRSLIEAAGYEGASVQTIESKKNLLIKLKSDSAKLDENGEPINIGEEMAAYFTKAMKMDVSLLQDAVVGAQIGEELANNGGIGMIVALIAVFLYVALRFQTKFSVGAIAALTHDVIIVLGLFSLFQLEFDLTVLAAVLAVVGYSLNDTIVVSDRIRENFRIMRSETAVDIINLSLSQTLGRTLTTSGTTLLVLFALFFLGGGLIHNFSVALIIGVGVGTYSSMYIAASTLVWMDISKEDLMEPEKEGAELDTLP